MPRKSLFWALFSMVSLALCPSAGICEAKTGGNLVVYCPHPIDFVDAIIQEFEVETGIRVEVVSAGTGELMKRVESESASPRADVVWGGSRASLENYKRFFDPYQSKNSPAFDPRYLDAGNRYTPFTAVPTVIMYNRNLVPAASSPTSWADLLGPEWRGRIAFADPSLSSSSFEALVNMLFAMGKGDPEAGWDYVAKFVRNLDGRLLASSSAVYKGVANGEYAIGVTFEEPAATYMKQGARVGIAYPSEGTIVEPDGVAIILGSRNPANARLFVDFVTSKKVQARIASDLNRRSCRIDVPAVSGLPALSSLRVLQGDYRWAVAGKERILGRFTDLARTRY